MHAHLQTGQAALIVSALAGCVALYGAVNSRRALAWQRRRDEERRTVKLEILCEHRIDTWRVNKLHDQRRNATTFQSAACITCARAGAGRGGGGRRLEMALRSA